MKRREFVYARELRYTKAIIIVIAFVLCRFLFCFFVDVVFVILLRETHREVYAKPVQYIVYYLSVCLFCFVTVIQMFCLSAEYS